MELVCQNCEVCLQPDFHHCPKCGQKTNLRRLTLRDVFHDAIHYFFHADKSLFTLLVQLAKHGGKVAREFVEGKRKKYFPPLNFFLLVATIYLFVQIKTDYPEVDVIKAYPELTQIQNEAKRQVLIEAYQRREHAIHFINQHSNTVMMASLPIIAAIFLLFYRRWRYNYTEHLAAGMYMFGFYTLLFTALDFLGHLLGMDGGMFYVIYWLGQIIYFPIFYRGFTHSSRKRAFFSSLAVMVGLFVINVICVWIYMFIK